MKINNLNITARLALSFSLVLILLTVVALLGIKSMSGIQNQLSTITNVNMIKMEQAATMRATILDRMIALRNLVLLSDSQELASEVERIQKGKVTYDMAKAELARILEREGGGRKTEQELVMQIQAVETEILPLMSKAEKLGLERKSDATTAILIKEIRPLQRKWVNAVTTLVGLQKQLSAEQTTIARKSYDNSRTLMIALTICAIASGIVAAVLVARSITRPLHKAVVIAETVASGDLSSCIESTSNDETGRLLAALAKMNSNLAEIVGKVRAGSGTIAIASSEIATGNLDLSSRTEQQASSLEETASSMEEITSAVKHNAENARQANDLAMIASSVASKGGQVVAEVIDTMNSIDASAKKIVDIIGVIDSIAFQTNILALNAAVEAARAGDQGRGFAVVASEVRNLAQRSATAAKEIKLLIDDSVEKVSTGSRLVGEAGATIKQVVKSVQSVTAVVSDISAASHEQELGIAQINKAIAEIDDVTQQNAALVEEASAAASSLQEHAGSLAKLVEFFVVGQPGSVSDHQVTNRATAEKAAQSSYGKVVALTSKVARNNDRILYTGRRQTMVSNGVADGNWEEF